MNDKETLLAHTLRCCVVIVSSRVCSLCWLRLCSLEYLQMWSLLQSLYSVLYKLKLYLLLLNVCAAQCAAATPQDNRRGTWSWTTGLHGSYSGNNRRDASTGETGEAGRWLRSGICSNSSHFTHKLYIERLKTDANSAYYCVSLRYNAVCVPAAGRGAPGTLRVSRPGQGYRSSLQLLTLHTSHHLAAA